MLAYISPAMWNMGAEVWNHSSVWLCQRIVSNQIVHPNASNESNPSQANNIHTSIEILTFLPLPCTPVFKANAPVGCMTGWPCYIDTITIFFSNAKLYIQLWGGLRFFFVKFIVFNLTSHILRGCLLVPLFSGVGVLQNGNTCPVEGRSCSCHCGVVIDVGEEFW